MSLQPLLDAAWIIQVHTCAALAAFAIGLVQLLAPKGTLPHRTLGMLWIVLMLVLAVSSIFILPSARSYDAPFLQWFSWIHILTVATFIGLGFGIWLLTKGGQNLKHHGVVFVSIFFGGLVVAGGLALIPGRLLHQVLSGSA